MSDPDVTYEFVVYQDGDEMAGGSCSTEADAMREANHYAMMYRQDAPVDVSVWRRTDLLIWSQTDAGYEVELPI
jgi:hypothetical protein